MAYGYSASVHAEQKVREGKVNPYDDIGNMYTFHGNKNFGVEMENFGVEMEHDHQGHTGECQRAGDDEEEVDGQPRESNITELRSGDHQEVTTTSPSIPTTPSSPPRVSLPWPFSYVFSKDPIEATSGTRQEITAATASVPATPASIPRVSMPGSFEADVEAKVDTADAEAAGDASELFPRSISSTHTEDTQQEQQQQCQLNVDQLSPRTVAKPHFMASKAPIIEDEVDRSPVEAATGATGLFSTPTHSKVKPTRQTRMYQRPPPDLLAAPVLASVPVPVPEASHPSRTFSMPMTDTDPEYQPIEVATATGNSGNGIDKIDEDLQDKIDALSETSELSAPPASDEEL